MKKWIAALCLFTTTLYGSVLLLGLYLRRAHPSTPSIASLDGESGDLIRRGQAIFDATPTYASEFAGNALSCESCHAAHGTQPFAAPMTGVLQRFPQYSARAGRVITLQDRVRECFVRSENGRPPTDDSAAMRALLAYFAWLSPPRANPAAAEGKGFVKLPALTPDPSRGAVLYSAQCAGCHGREGEGRTQAWPPLWGSQSFNDGAGMNRIPTMAAFVQHNMPQNRMGNLNPQDAWDLAAYIHQQQRPKLNPAYALF